jgi:hypothetical protein
VHRQRRHAVNQSPELKKRAVTTGTARFSFQASAPDLSVVVREMFNA